MGTNKLSPRPNYTSEELEEGFHKAMAAHDPKAAVEILRMLVGVDVAKADELHKAIKLALRVVRPVDEYDYQHCRPCAQGGETVKSVLIQGHEDIPVCEWHATHPHETLRLPPTAHVVTSTTQGRPLR